MHSAAHLWISACDQQVSMTASGTELGEHVRITRIIKYKQPVLLGSVRQPQEHRLHRALDSGLPSSRDFCNVFDTLLSSHIIGRINPKHFPEPGRTGEIDSISGRPDFDSQILVLFNKFQTNLSLPRTTHSM